MSYHFYVPADNKPPMQEFLSALGVSDLALVGAARPPTDWGGEPLGFYRQDLSCRAVYLRYEDGEFSVGTFAYSAAEDFELALRIARTLASLSDSEIRGEDEECSHPVHEFEVRYGSEWVASQRSFYARFLRANLAEGKELEFQAPGRMIFLGPRVGPDLIADGDPEGISARLDELVRHILYGLSEDHYPASIMTMRFPEREEPVSVSVLAPGLNYLYYPVDFLGMADTPHGLLHIPWSEVPALVGPRFRLVDERQATIQAIPPEEWLDFCDRAAEVARKRPPVPLPPATPPPPRRPWWRLWGR